MPSGGADAASEVEPKGDATGSSTAPSPPRRRTLRQRCSTVRAKATIAATLVVAVTLVLSAVTLRVLLRRSLQDSLEASAKVRAAELATLVRGDAVPDELAVHADEDALTQIVGPSGEVIAASGNLAGAPPLGPIPASSNASPFTVQLGPAGDPDLFRVVVTTVASAGGTTTIFVGSSLDPVNESVDATTRLVVVGIPVLIAVVAIATWLLVGRALRPVELIRAEVADISEGDLHRRVPEPDTDDEVGRLARTMNATLDRLAESVERQRRFVADASHELQSPVATAKVMLDVAIAHPDEADWPRVAGDVREEHDRIERLVRDLLFLARREGGAGTLVVGPVDLDDIVHRELARLDLRPGLRVDASGVRPVELEGDADQLSRVVRNLLENARLYAAGTITLTTRRVTSAAAPEAELVVADDGPGVPDADRERIFDRFARADGARDRRTGGTGLGLAIARDIVHAHGGTIVIADGDGGARFVVRLPANP